MTWPFENDTSGIVKRISNRSISANRKRNIFIVLTIVLASALLSAIVLYGFGVMQETQNRNQKTAQIMYHAISEQQGQELYKQEEIAWVGEFFNAFSEQVNHSTVNFTYANADMLTSQSMPYSGDLPASENEIVVQESFLDSLGYSNELGQTCLLYTSYKGDLARRNTGSLVAFETGESITYGLFNAQERGQLFIGAGVPVYEGMVVGVSPKQEDITVNVCKKKQLTNMRASGSDDALRLVPPKQMSLEQCLEFLADDELLEVTPHALRIRKTILNHEKRMKATHGGKK